MKEDEFLAWVAEIELVSDPDAYFALKKAVLERCKVFSQYEYELKIVLDKKRWDLLKVDRELLAYNVPISRIIEENSVKDIQEIENKEFLIHVEQGRVQGLESGD